MQIKLGSKFQFQSPFKLQFQSLKTLKPRIRGHNKKQLNIFACFDLFEIFKYLTKKLFLSDFR